MLNDLGDLSIAELVYWAPATILAIFVCIRHGFARQAGWLVIVLLGLCRLIGASCTIAYEQQTVPSRGLITAAAVTSSIGLSFLISVILGLLSRLAAGMQLAMLPPRILRLLQLVLLAGIIISAIGGSDLGSGGKNVSEGKTLLKVGVILFLIGFIVTAAGLVIVTLNRSRVPEGENRLVLACWLSLPFVFVRLLFSLLCVFAEDSTFNYYEPNFWVRAFMAVAMEFIVATIIIVTGLITQKTPNNQAQRDYDQQGYDTRGSTNSNYGPPKDGYGYSSQA